MIGFETNQTGFFQLKISNTKFCKMIRLVHRKQCSIAKNIRKLSHQNVQCKIAVVGAGPAGFYASQHLLKNVPHSTVDIYEALPVPFGLVRYGVAPDHPEVKNCITTFNKVGSNDRVNFVGNTRLGQDVMLSDLLANYHAVLCTYGVDKDRSLNIPGESLSGVLSARDLVSLYNGAPDSNTLHSTCLNTESVAIIGVGNVALDVARLILAPVDSLRKTDVSDTWLQMRSESRVKRVVIIGRRGPLNVSFTIKELREMIKLKHVNTIMNEADFNGVQEQLATLERPRKRLTELMLKSKSQGTYSEDQSWELKLWRTPNEILGKDSVTGLKICNTKDPSISEIVECGLVVRSVGYSSSQADPQLPWDSSKSVMANKDGRAGPGLYTAGWLATGPRGVIIDTMNTAFKVAANIASDLNGRNLEEKKGRISLEKKLVKSTSWEDWEKIDKEEVRRGEIVGKSREKIVSPQEMIKIIKCSQ